LLAHLQSFRRIHMTATAGKLIHFEAPQGKNREQVLQEQTDEIKTNE
jgi:hypothetical protein